MLLISFTHSWGQNSLKKVIFKYLQSCTRLAFSFSFYRWCSDTKLTRFTITCEINRKSFSHFVCQSFLDLWNWNLRDLKYSELFIKLQQSTYLNLSQDILNILKFILRKNIFVGTRFFRIFIFSYSLRTFKYYYI